MFHIDGEQLIKTSNGKPVPDGEPLFILRGRDRLAVKAIEAYQAACFADGCDKQRLDDVGKVIGEFNYFAHANAAVMKQPGITKGK